MRASRLLVAVLALALLGLVPSMSSASASSSTASTAGASSTSTAPTTAVSPRVKTLTAKIVKRRSGALFITGVIRPKKGPVVIQKATSCNRQTGTCNFKQFRKTKINNRGRYTVRVSAPDNGSWAWRAVKGKTASEIWVTCKKRPGADCPVP